jgi:hypothetical protein
MKRRKLLLQFVSGIITFFVVSGLILSFFSKDLATSVEPGWHTTIFTQRAAFSIVIYIIVCGAFTWLVFKSVLWILIKIFSLHPDGQRTNG